MLVAVLVIALDRLVHGQLDVIRGDLHRRGHASSGGVPGHCPGSFQHGQRAAGIALGQSDDGITLLLIEDHLVVEAAFVRYGAFKQGRQVTVGQRTQGQ